MMINVNNYLFSVAGDNETINVTCPNGKEYSFRSSNDGCGKIIAIQQYGKRLLIIRDYCIETFQATLEPSRFRLETRLKSMRRLIHPRQAEYLMRRKKNDDVTKILERRTNKAGK
ncbi:MAG: hypothetical protein FWC00_04985 [Firmicutes bacterium]|nr:hypothetical protein [Bacillota bacterium]